MGGVVKADLGADLGVGKMELGWCDTALVLPYAAIQILYPGIADRYGPKRALVCCLALAGLTTLSTYSAPSLFFFMVGLVATGALLAPCWPACTKILGLWFHDSRLNSVFGLINTATYSGGVGGTALAATLVSYSGWRSVATPPAVVAFATALCLACLLSTPRERGLSVPGKEPLLPQEKVSPSTSAPLSALIRLHQDPWSLVPRLASQLQPRREEGGSHVEPAEHTFSTSPFSLQKISTIFSIIFIYGQQLGGWIEAAPKLSMQHLTPYTLGMPNMGLGLCFEHIVMFVFPSYVINVSEFKCGKYMTIKVQTPKKKKKKKKKKS